MNPPDFFIVGAPKCGTTAMHHYLGQHPQVFMPAEKEVHHHGRDLAGLPATLSPERHRAMFDGSEGFAIAGESCIWALYSTEAAAEIRVAHPDASIVVMLRDPVEMIRALHAEFLYQGIEDLPSLEAALAAAPDRLGGRRLPCGNLFPAAIYDYRAVATFAGQVERYHDAFGRDRVHVILLEDLRRDASAVYRRLLEFLGVDPAFRADLSPVNESKRLRSVLVQQLRFNPRHRWHPWFLRRCESPRWDGRLARALVARNVRHAPQPPLPPRLRSRLHSEFAPEVERLGRALGRDLTETWTAFADDQSSMTHVSI